MGDYEEGWKSCPLPRCLVGGNPCGPILSHVGISLYQAEDGRVITKQIWTDFHRQPKKGSRFFAHFSLTQAMMVHSFPAVGPCWWPLFVLCQCIIYHSFIRNRFLKHRPFGPTQNGSCADGSKTPFCAENHFRNYQKRLNF